MPDFAKLDRADAVRAEDERLKVYHLTNPDTGSQVYVVRNDTDAPITTTIPAAGIDVAFTVAAHDARLLAANLQLGERTLKYATAQPMMYLKVGRMDVAVFTAPHGEMAQVLLECPEEPLVTRGDSDPA